MCFFIVFEGSLSPCAGYASYDCVVCGVQDIEKMYIKSDFRAKMLIFIARIRFLLAGAGAGH